MLHFLIELTYIASPERLADTVTAHRAFLQAGYDRGLLLLSGPQEPRTGGIVVARAASRAEIEVFFAQDPYRLEGLATYRMVQFEPVKHQPWLADWISG